MYPALISTHDWTYLAPLNGPMWHRVIDRSLMSPATNPRSIMSFTWASGAGFLDEFASILVSSTPSWERPLSTLSMFGTPLVDSSRVRRDLWPRCPKVDRTTSAASLAPDLVFGIG